jgi:DNA-binding NarL/FixJ family response regulator
VDAANDREAEQRATGSPPGTLRLLIADDHRTLAEALATGLDALGQFETVDVALSADHARMLVSVRRYDVVLLDPILNVGAWLAFLRSLTARAGATVVVVVSELDDVEQVVALLAENVRAWVSPDVSLEALVRLIGEAVQGRTSLPPALLGPVLEELLGRRVSRQPRSFVDDLTPRQLEILECLAHGMSRTQVAERLLLSPHTVRTHIHEVLRKAGVHSTLAALAKARDAGFLEGRPPAADWNHHELRSRRSS